MSRLIEQIKQKDACAVQLSDDRGAFSSLRKRKRK